MGSVAFTEQIVIKDAVVLHVNDGDNDRQAGRLVRRSHPGSIHSVVLKHYDR